MCGTNSMYVNSTITPLTEEALKNRPCTYPKTHPDYVPPTPEEVDGLIKIAGWSQRQAARMAGVSHGSSGSSTIRRWRTPIKNKKEYREIPYSAWRLLLFAAGICSIDQDLYCLKQYSIESDT